MSPRSDVVTVPLRPRRRLSRSDSLFSRASASGSVFWGSGSGGGGGDATGGLKKLPMVLILSSEHKKRPERACRPAKKNLHKRGLQRGVFDDFRDLDTLVPSTKNSRHHFSAKVN